MTTRAEQPEVDYGQRAKDIHARWQRNPAGDNADLLGLGQMLALIHIGTQLERIAAALEDTPVSAGWDGTDPPI
jgi:hypothetical protein